MSVEWNQKYEIEISEIDTQHKRLFQLLSDLEELYFQNKGRLTQKSKDINTSLSNLEEYTVSHFLIEERIMEDNDYPELESHKSLHDKFTNKILEAKETLSEERMIADETTLDEYLNQVIKFLQGWLKGHIMVKDIDYKPFIRRVL